MEFYSRACISEGILLKSSFDFKYFQLGHNCLRNKSRLASQLIEV